MAGPSPHLSWAELACHDEQKTAYPAAWRSSRLPTLAAEFERIRSVIGAPIQIGSAYRTPDYNRRIGGARNSQHCEGRALDLYPPAGWTLDRFYGAIRLIALEPTSRIYGLGRYPTFVHIDVRPRPAHGRLTVWQGSRAWAESKSLD